MIYRNDKCFKKQNICSENSVTLQVVNLHYFVPLEERLLNDHVSDGNEGPLLTICTKTELLGI